ncbi:MAG: hypothetical protein K2L21_02765 [Muribaculaceae bacterium]|nr:hypothetical protein [Muribaculaceae bacterium]
MRNFTLIALCVALAVPVSQAARTEHSLAKKHIEAVKKAKAEKSKKLKALAAEAAAKWCSQTQKAYGWNGEDWELEETYTKEYNQEGLTIVNQVEDYDGYINREENTWNENGMLATRFTTVAESADEPFKNYSKLSRTYDEKVPSFIVSNQQYIWNGEDWSESNFYSQNVTRDDAGNVISMERAVFYQGALDPTYRLTVTYGADGKATTIKDCSLDYDYDSGEYVWVDGSLISDIEWENTDGQILSVENLFTGANRIKSAVITNVEFDEVQNYTAEYATDGSYTLTMTMHDDYWDEDVKSVLYYTPLDENGSYKTVVVNTYYEDGDTEPYMSETTTETGKYDAYGLILLEEMTYGDGTYEEVEDLTVGTVEYDTENGYPLTWTVQVYDPDEDEMYNQLRAEYSDYINAGVADAIVDADAPVEYFNLQGMRINEPAAGQVVIRRQGNKATKIFVK